MKKSHSPKEPVSGTIVPRYAGPSTFCRLPELRDVSWCDVAILGVPFDSGTSYRPGASFGPQAIRQASRHLRYNFHPVYQTEPFKSLQVADAGDVACNPYSIDEAILQIETTATDLNKHTDAIVSLGGDHTIAVPLLRAANKKVILISGHHTPMERPFDVQRKKGSLWKMHPCMSEFAARFTVRMI